MQNSHQIFTLHDIISAALPVFSLKHSLRILEVFDEIFEDIPQLDPALGASSNVADETLFAICDEDFEGIGEDSDTDDFSEMEVL